MSKGMDNASVTARSERLARLAREHDDPAFRASYMAHHLRAFLADQIRGLRGEMSQAAFGRLIGKPQSVVSRLENEEYGKVTLQTLIDIATRLDIAFVGRFVSFPAFLDATMDFSEAAVAPRPCERGTARATGTKTSPVSPVQNVGAVPSPLIRPVVPSARTAARRR